MKYFLPAQLLVILFLIGCSKPERIVPGQPVKVIIWEFGGLPGMQAWTKKAVAEFNASHEDIQIELEQPTQTNSTRNPNPTWRGYRI